MKRKLTQMELVRLYERIGNQKFRKTDTDWETYSFTHL